LKYESGVFVLGFLVPLPSPEEPPPDLRLLPLRIALFLAMASNTTGMHFFGK
jgi:hypothetical protein